MTSTRPVPTAADEHASVRAGSVTGRTDDGPTPAERHLQRLERALPLLADISLADVLVLKPTQPYQADPADQSFGVTAHRRPINARTVYEQDRVGGTVTGRERPLLSLAWETGEITDGGVYLTEQERWIRTLAVPVRHNGEIIAMLSREFSPTVEEIPGDLQLTSFQVLRRLAAMIADGVYPYPVETRQHDHPPRVGDGLMLLDPLGIVEYASPNATTVLRSVGIPMLATGRRMSDLGINSRMVLSAHGQRLAFFDEYEKNGKSMSMACYPLLEEGRVTGSLVLLRDISELRSRDRLLLTKDATIAEIHHRVKNNLQTISSLLHLQSRRTESEDARTAIEESVRRIRAIAVVHEILSHKSSDEVPFGDVVHPLVQIVRDALLAPGQRVRFTVEADDSILPSEMTTTLAVVVNELLQNCIDHAFPDHGAAPGSSADESQHEVRNPLNFRGRSQLSKRLSARPPGTAPGAESSGEDDSGAQVTIRMSSVANAFTLEVADNGVGLPEDFATAKSGLGLTIVRTLVESELRGVFTNRRSGDENIFSVTVPLHPGTHTV